MPQPGSDVPPYDLDARDEVDLQRIWQTLVRGRWLILAAALVGLALGALASRVVPPVYESAALLRIVPEDRGFDLGPANSMRLLLGLEGSGDIQTAIGILQSRRIAEAVVDSLALHVRLREPGRPRDEVVRVLEAPRTTQRLRYVLRLQPDGTYRIAAPRGAAGQGPIEVGRTAHVGGLVLQLDPALRAALPKRIVLDVQPFPKAIDALQKRLAVSQPYSGSQLVRLNYRHADPALVAAVPNLVAENFIAYKHSTASSESRSMVAFLREQARQYQADLRAAEDRLQAHLERTQIIEPRTQAEVQARRLAELQAERESLRSESEGLRALLRQIEATPTAPDAPSPYRQLVAFPSFLTNDVVHSTLQTIMLLENERAELLVRRTESNRDVHGLTTRIRELELQLYAMARNYLNDVERRLALLDATLARFADQVARLPAREVELRRLTREATLLEEVNQLIETRLKEEEIRAAAQLADVQVVDPAPLPFEPEFPKLWMTLLLGGLLGTMVGAGTAVARAHGRSTIRTRADVTAATAGLPVLAAIDLPHVLRHPAHGGPRATAVVNGDGNGRRPRWIARWPEWRPSAGVATPVPPLLSTPGNEDRLGDAYRALRTNLGLGGQRGGVLLIAGSDADDGAALTAANLAIAYAQQGTPTVLIDANLRSGALHALLGVERRPGLAEALLEPARLSEVLQTVELPNSRLPLDFVATGTAAQNPADAFSSPAMGALLKRLRENHPAVILAAPPINAAPDASVLAPLVDRTLLVVTAEVTERSAVEEAIRQLRHLQAPVGGVVVNGRA